jgi:hypothetical protein
MLTGFGTCSGHNFLKKLQREFGEEDIDLESGEDLQDYVGVEVTR